MTTFTSGGQFDDELLSALGHMTMEFTMLDAALDNWIGMYLMPAGGMEYILASAVTANIPFIGRVEVFGALYRLLLGESHRSDELKTLLTRLGKVNEKRNSLSHSMWTRGKNTSEATTFSSSSRRGRG